MHFENSQCHILSLGRIKRRHEKYVRGCGKSTRQNERKSEDEKTYSQEVTFHLSRAGAAHNEQDICKVSQSVVVHLIIAMVINIT